jgi:ribosomal protein S18 acetylase RimI-like enzyme
MPSTDDVTLSYHESDEATKLLEQLCDVYADAYGVEQDGEKTSAFRTRAIKALERPRYGLIVAQDNNQIIGFAFGYALPADTFWWDGLTPAGPEGFTTEDGTRTFVLAEIEVRRAWQGKGVGRALNDAILGRRSEERATLATGPNTDAAQALYEHWNWQPVGKILGEVGSYFSEYILYVLPLPPGDRR